MRIEIRARGIDLTDDLRERLLRRLSFAMACAMTRPATCVVVRLQDENGPRGGIDKRCRIQVDHVPSGPLLIEDRDADLRALIDRVTGRLGRTLRRRQRQMADWSPALGVRHAYRTPSPPSRM
jgi:ribosome-associated translation inhibitor RaiA